MDLAVFSEENNPHVRVMSGGFIYSNLKTLLSIADKNGFGIPACNVRSRFVLNAILEAAFKVKSPVILEIAESETSYCNMLPARLADLAQEAINRMIVKYDYTIPICLHHDHVQKDVDGCVQRAIEAGFSSVEIDLSKLPVEDNAKKCVEVRDKIYPLGISLEVEDGEIGTADALADPEVEKNIASYYSKVDDCKKLCEIVGPTALAFFVGNGHGQYLKAPIIGYDRIKEICDTVRSMGVYGVMHGGSGLTAENFNSCIKSGARKFNYATSLSDIWFKYFPAELVERMKKTGEEQGKPLRKVLNQFEAEWDKMNFAAAEKEITDHLVIMMEKGFLSAGKADLYKYI